MSTTFILLGFSTPADNAPSFSTPVFKKNQTLFLQVINQDENISDFEEVEHIEFDTYESPDNTEYNIGDKAVYAIKDHKRQLILHNKKKMDEYLKSNIRQISAYPYFYKSVLEFSNLNLNTPEYSGCKNNKDFLLWQVLSITAKEFINPINCTKQLRLADKKKPQISALAATPSKQRFVMQNNKYQDYRESYFESFISFAQSKHQRLSKEKTVLESLVLSEYISHILPKTTENLESVRASLVKMLEYSKQDSSSAPLQKMNTMHVKKTSKYALNCKLIPRHVIDENTDGLSLIIFVTAVINHIQTGQES